MKTIWMILLGALVSTGCYGNPVSSDPDVSEIASAAASSAAVTTGVVKLRFDEIITHEGLELRLLKVMDSRCPIGANCFWAGEVKVILEAINVEQAGTEPVEFQLTLQVRQEPTTTAVLGYEMKLLDVSPYPREGVTPERTDYLAEINISETAKTR
jgi:hypothetical protein